MSYIVRSSQTFSRPPSALCTCPLPVRLTPKTAWNFSVIHDTPNWLGIYWAGYLQNGIHALPILSNGQRLWEGLLGQRVSYGCVILGIWEAQTLYDWAEVGVPVNIQY